MTTIAFDRPIDLAVTIPVPEAEIEGDWSVPPRPRGTIILATVTGNGRLNRRNREIAKRLYDASFATLLLDLLTPEEEEENTFTGALRLDVGLFTTRLRAAIHWVKDESETGELPLGILAAGTASAAALSAAAHEGDLVNAIVSRGGRPDLAGIDLHRVLTPTLLIIGSDDTVIYELNRWALRRINGEKHLAVVPGDSQLFEGRRALDTMCRIAVEWFEAHMPMVMPIRVIRPMFETTWTPDHTSYATT